MLDEGMLIRSDANLLRAVSPDADRVLRDAFSAAANGDVSLGVRGVHVPLMASQNILSHTDGWSAHVLPLTSGRRHKAGLANDAVVAVFVRKLTPNATAPLEAIATRYKLTAREARVLDAVLKVNGLKAVAEMLDLSHATVKTHLHNVFRKTGTARQSDLVRLLAGIKRPQDQPVG